MSGWLYTQVALQAFVTIGGALSCVGCLYVAASEWWAGRKTYAGMWVFLSFAGVGIALAAGPFLMDSLPSLSALSYMAGETRWNTFGVARVFWALYAAGTLTYIWIYTQRSRWFAAPAVLSSTGFCLWILWLVKEIHG